MDNNITIIGVGKLGLGFALLLEHSGYNVLGLDIFPNYVNDLNTKNFRSSEPYYNELLDASTNFKATTNIQEAIDFSDLIFIIVQTPNSGGDRFYDHSILSNVLEKINQYRPKDKNIIIGCTVMPTYIDQVGNDLIKDCEDSYLSYNPEFVAQGDIINGFKNPDIILVGTLNEKLKPRLTKIYQKLCDNEPTFCFMKPLEAEITKISLNGFLTTKISFANMIYDLCDTLGANQDTVLNAIGTDSRIGRKYFRSGYSFGGPCFPRDTKALKQIMDQNNIYSHILKGTTESNEWHTEYQAEKLLSLNQDEYVFENVSYKEGSSIPIIEESAKLKIAKYLVQKGKRVIIKDYEKIISEVKKEFGNKFMYQIK